MNFNIVYIEYSLLVMFLISLVSFILFKKSKTKSFTEDKIQRFINDKKYDKAYKLLKRKK